MKRLMSAYPLFVKDPFFSLWSSTENLNDSNPVFWAGEEKNIYGVIYVDSKPYCFLGNMPLIAKINQTNLSVSSYTTDYKFENEKVILNLSFVSPLLLDDPRLLSCPVCYLKYSVTKKVECETQLVLAINGNISYNRNLNEIDSKEIRGGNFTFENFECAWCGLKRQAPLSYSADFMQADWGYFYISGEKTAFESDWLSSELLPKTEEKFYIVSKNNADSSVIMLAFDDIVSIAYYGDYLKGLYFAEGKTVFDALEETYNNVKNIDELLDNSNKKIIEIAKPFGEEYLNLLFASLRQSIGAHKLVKDTNGEILFLSKECCSNGCIATVDVSYPSIPLYLLFNTEYVKGMMRPIFKFANMPVWTFDFAPHDAGTYPICSGQVYGLDHNNKYVKTDGALVQSHPDIFKFPNGKDVFIFDKQMPVEECANMIIMAYACYYYDCDKSFLQENFETLSKWVNYLCKYGLKPENQLCTDDFAGHLKNNVNLAIKATVAIKCYAKICEALGKEYSQFDETAKRFANEIEEFGFKYNHLPLTWDSDDSTFSLKYNFAFDKLLGLNLFSEKTFEREIDCYLQRANEYGTPLDTRESYTKSDWLLWSAVLSNDLEKQKQIISKVNHFLTHTKQRVPFSDWFDTVNGNYYHFKNRTVQGGIFILPLLKRIKN